MELSPVNPPAVGSGPRSQRQLSAPLWKWAWLAKNYAPIKCRLRFRVELFDYSLGPTNQPTNVLVNYLAISWTGLRTERLTILRAATHETGLGDHDFCLSQSHYTDTDPTSRMRAATGGIEPGTSSPGVVRSSD